MSNQTDQLVKMAAVIENQERRIHIIEKGIIQQANTTMRIVEQLKSFEEAFKILVGKKM